MMPGFAPLDQGPEFVHPDDVEESISSPVFIELDTEPEKEISMAARSIKAAVENPSTSIRVKVVGNYRVVSEGRAYIGGEVLEIPDDAEHKVWLQSGFVVKEK
jgi:hypothetical protein